jgi:hypothetical protein
MANSPLDDVTVVGVTAIVPSLVNVTAFVVVAPTPTSPKSVPVVVRLGPSAYTWTLALVPPAADPGLARNTTSRPAPAMAGALKPPVATGDAVLRGTAGFAVVKVLMAPLAIVTATAVPSGERDGSMAPAVTSDGVARFTETKTPSPVA